MGRFIEVETLVPEYGFVAKAVSNDKTRYFMNFVYCEDGKLISTDGRRLHILELGENPYDFEDGKFYRVLKTTSKIVWFVEHEVKDEFPNWKRVIPTGEYETMYFVFSKRSENNTLNLAKLYRHAAVNIDYLKDLVKDYVWEVRIFKNDKAVMFVNGGMTAVIMPLREE